MKTSERDPPASLEVAAADADKSKTLRKPTGASLGEDGEDDLLEQTSDEAADETEVRVTPFATPARDICVIGLFALAVFYTLYFTRPLVLPLMFAVLLNFLLSPLVRSLYRYGIPRTLSAGVLLFSILSILFFGAYRISTPASAFVSAIPTRLPLVEDKLRAVIRPMQEVARTAEEVERATGNGDSQAIAVAIRGPDMIETAVGYVRSFGAGALITLIMLMFLLSMNQLFLHKLVRVLPTFHDKRLAVEIFREIESDISRYLATVTLINFTLGAAVTLAMYLIGVPNPIMWGVMVGLFNYILYLGPAASFIVLMFVGILTFDEFAWMCAPALIFLGLNLIEAYCVTPLTLGNRLDLNPVAILLSLAVWGFVWGLPGMLLAVPLLVILKLFCDHVERLNPVSEFLSGAESPTPKTLSASGTVQK